MKLFKRKDDIDEDLLAPAYTPEPAVPLPPLPPKGIRTDLGLRPMKPAMRSLPLLPAQASPGFDENMPPFPKESPLLNSPQLPDMPELPPMPGKPIMPALNDDDMTPPPLEPMTALSEAKPPRDARVFVRLDKYNNITKMINQMENKINELQGEIKKINEAKMHEKGIIDGWEDLIRDTKEKIADIQSKLPGPD